MGYAHAFFVAYMARALQIFKRKLTNLSSANPILWMRRLKVDIHLDLTEAENATGFPSWKLLDEILSGKGKVHLVPVVDSGSGDANLLSRRLHILVRRQQLVMQERGVDQLFLAFGFVQGCWPDGSWVRTPLLYFPCSLRNNQKNWSIEAKDSEAFINPAFLLAYAFHFKREVESTLFEKELDLASTDSLTFLTAFYQRLKESNLDIHFNREMFEQRIQPFPSITKETLPSGYQPGMLRIQPHLVLGLFPQSNSLLVSDFEYLEQYQIGLEDIFVKHLPVFQSVSEKNLLCPLPVDGSQEACIRQVKSGQSLVVQGPPGTGKSQLISNVMADAIGMGKSVLLVCQKRVALEVVQNRLKKVGLEEFVALWSDYKKDRESVYRQLAGQIDRIEEVEKVNSKLDTVVLERRFAFASQLIDQVSLKIEDWRSALFDVQHAGVSIKELYSRKIKWKLNNFEVSNLVLLKWDQFQMFRIWLTKNWSSLVITYGRDFPLHNRQNLFRLGESAFDQIPVQWTLLEQESEKIFNTLKENQWNLDLSQWDREITRIYPFTQIYVAEVAKIRLAGPGFLFQFHPGEWVDQPLWNELEVQIHRLEILLTELEIWPSALVIPVQQIDQYLGFIERWHAHSKVGIWWNFLGLVKSEVADFKKFAQVFPKGLRSPDQLHKILVTAREFIHACQALRFPNVSTLSLVELENVKVATQQWKEGATEIAQIQNALVALLPIVTQPNSLDWEILGQMVAWLSSAHTRCEGIRQSWQSFFNTHIELKLPLQFAEIAGLKECFLQCKDEIWLADKALAEAESEWSAVAFEVLRNKMVSGLTKPEMLQCLEDFWTQAWVRKLESQFPVLAEVSREEWNEDLELLRTKIEEKQELVAAILKQRLSEQTYKELEHNRLRNRVTYRDLYHQVTKKRQRWPMRQLWEQSEVEILKLIPAWLATPESVSATWPMEMRFDLVIFDEASQCFAESGIPAAFRGRQLLVIGDDKQLPPNHLFSSRWDEESEEEALFSDQDSLLDLAKQFLPQTLLRSHYRSQYPELIEFSNQHFYQNKLETIPLPEVYQNRAPALRFEKVEGIWKNQQNQAEAEYLCSRVLESLSANKEESIGIITFNQKQQELIEQLLDHKADLAAIFIPDSLFVKNIENVQGDERDHIWFSIAYAKNEQGKVVSQFGSMSQMGGENRLNVAVSRARKSITVISSILPSELLISESSPTGPRLLQKYLEFVHQISEAKDHHKPIRNLEANPVELMLPFADRAYKELDGVISLDFEDSDLLYSAASLKDFFGYKYLNLTSKGYKVRYRYRRKEWMSLLEGLQ